MKKNITLALETGIYGGSVCLLKDGAESAGWIGKAEQTKSREFLEAVKKVLGDAQISIAEIREVVISAGPGSYTGLRIGASIAKGLKTALGISVRGVSPLDEMMKDARPITIAVLPFGKNEICWKEKERETVNSFKLKSSVKFSPKIDFVKLIKKLKPDNLVLPSGLYNELSGFEHSSASTLNIIQCDENLARLIGSSEHHTIYKGEEEIFYPKPFKVK